MSYATTAPAARFAALRVYLAEAGNDEYADAGEFAGVLVATLEQIEGVASAEARVIGDEAVLVIGYESHPMLARDEAEGYADVLAGLTDFDVRVTGTYLTTAGAWTFER